MFRTMTLADALAVLGQMRRQDADCFDAVTGPATIEHRAMRYHQQDGAAWTLMDGDVPVAIGGVSMPVPWIGVVWMVGTDRLSPVMWKKLIRHGRKVLGNASKHLRRVECHVLSTWPEALVFARRMGFELEGVRHGAGRDGEDILTMVYRGRA